MNDRNLEVLELYDIDVVRVTRGRGAFLIWADNGLYRLSEYTGAGGRLAYEEKLLSYIEEHSSMRVDKLMRTKEGNMYAEDMYGGKYTLKKWYEGNECDVKRNHDLLNAVHTLAKLHLATEYIDDEDIASIAPKSESVGEEYTRYNEELRRVRNFMRKRTRKTQFEYDVLAHFDEYYGYANEAYNRLMSSDIGEIEEDAYRCCSICHGTYNYHNIIMQGNDTAVVNFDHSVNGPQIMDLYLFLRKVLEKYDWNIQLGHQLLERYDHTKSISDRELTVLQIMLSYPEKYRKVLNQYNNSNKSWIPDKNVEKLKVVYRQQELKMAFAKSL